MDITRQVETLWQREEMNIKAQGATMEQIAEWKQAFYAGVFATLRYQHDDMATLALTPRLMIEHLNAMYVEAKEFLYPNPQR